MTTFHRPLPAALLPLAEDYTVLETALDGLAESHEPAARAELAEELVRRAALIEDTLAQVVHPFLERHGEEPLLDRLAPAARAAGEAMVPVHKVMRHTVPMDAHAEDPAGVEMSIERAANCVGAILEIEEGELFPVLNGLAEDDGNALADEVALARRHALEHPLPPSNPIHRLLTRIEERLEHHQDTSHQYRPNREDLEG